MRKVSGVEWLGARTRFLEVENACLNPLRYADRADKSALASDGRAAYSRRILAHQSRGRFKTL